MFEELVGGKGYSGGQDKDCMAHLKEDMSVFGMKLDGWRKAARKGGRWFRRVEEGAQLFMRNRHETERRKAGERRAKAAAGPSTADMSTQLEGGGMGEEGREGGEGGGRGRGGKGGVMPKRLKSGSGHHGLEICGPSNGRPKIA